MKKKLLSWLLVVALVITMVPGSALAAETNATTNQVEITGETQELADGKSVSVTGLNLDPNSDGVLPEKPTKYKAGEGYIIFTPATSDSVAKLELVNARINVSEAGDTPAIMLPINMPIDIFFSGTNTLAADYGIQSNGDTKITLIGTDESVLNIKAAEGSQNRPCIAGIDANGPLKFQSGTVNFNNPITAIELMNGVHDTLNQLVIEKNTKINITSSNNAMNLANTELLNKGDVKIGKSQDAHDACSAIDISESSRIDNSGKSITTGYGNSQIYNSDLVNSGSIEINDANLVNSGSIKITDVQNQSGIICNNIVCNGGIVEVITDAEQYPTIDCKDITVNEGAELHGINTSDSWGIKAVGKIENHGKLLVEGSIASNGTTIGNGEYIVNDPLITNDNLEQRKVKVALPSGLVFNGTDQTDVATNAIALTKTMVLVLATDEYNKEFKVGKWNYTIQPTEVKNAGIYTVEFNYENTENKFTQTFEVAAKPMDKTNTKITVDNSKFAYQEGQDITNTAKSAFKVYDKTRMDEPLVLDTDYEIKFSSDFEGQKPVNTINSEGTYYAVITTKADSNYKFAEDENMIEPIKFIVAKEVVPTVEINGFTATYNGTAQYPKGNQISVKKDDQPVTGYEIVYSKNAEGTQLIDKADIKNVGKYYVVVRDNNPLDESIIKTTAVAFQIDEATVSLENKAVNIYDNADKNQTYDLTQFTKVEGTWKISDANETNPLITTGPSVSEKVLLFTLADDAKIDDTATIKLTFTPTDKNYNGGDISVDLSVKIVKKPYIPPYIPPVSPEPEEVIKPEPPKVPDTGANLGMTDTQKKETDTVLGGLIDKIVDSVKPDAKPDTETPEIPEPPKTEAEKETVATEQAMADAAKNNEKINVKVDATNVDMKNTTEEIKNDVTKIENEITKNLGNSGVNLLQVANIQVTAQATNKAGETRDLGILNNLKEKISFTFQLPLTTVGQYFGVVRIHDGKVEILPMSDIEFDPITKAITFKTDRFSTYAVYEFDPNAPELKLDTIEKIDDQTFEGTAITPNIVVKNANGDVLANNAYTVQWIDNDKIGTAKVIVKGNSDYNYKGTLEQTFTIKDKIVKPGIVNNINIDTDNGLFKVTFDKLDNATNYRVYVTKAGENNWRWYNAKNGSALVKQLYKKPIVKNGKYQVKVVAFNGDVKGEYSKAKTIFANRIGTKSAKMFAPKFADITFAKSKEMAKTTTAKVIAKKVYVKNTPKNLQYKVSYRLKGTKTWKSAGYSAKNVKYIKGLKKGKVYNFAVRYRYTSAVDGKTIVNSGVAYRAMKVK